MITIHELKSWIGLFEPIYKGDKTHDLRVMDRNYKVGDFCNLREYDPLKMIYTNRQILVKITYITSSQHQECAVSPTALHHATGILSIRHLNSSDYLEILKEKTISERNDFVINTLECLTIPAWITEDENLHYAAYILANEYDELPPLNDDSPSVYAYISEGHLIVKDKNENS